MRRSLLALALLPLAAMAGAQERRIIPDWPEPTPRPSQRYVFGAPSNAGPDVPLPQDALLVPTLPNIMANREEIYLAYVGIDIGLEDDNPFWQMSTAAKGVFLRKLANWEQGVVAEDAIWPNIPDPDERYSGALVLLQTYSGRRFAPMRVHRGEIRAMDGSLIATDPGRSLEYWLFGTARVRRDQLLGVRVLPIYTFEQCRVLGQRIIPTTPRQCLLADNNLLLETAEPPTLQSARITTFDQCLKQGTGLIYTFPRRCVAAGGKVFTEPPQVRDPIPAPAPQPGRSTAP